MRIEENGFSLKNSGELELFFIGVGSAFASTLNQTNFLIVKGDAHIMVDFGMTGPNALLETTGLKPTDIGVILPTHSHADHVGGIECLALMNRHIGIPSMNKPKMTMIVSKEYQRLLWNLSLRGGLEWNEEEEDSKRMLSLTDYFYIIQPEWKSCQPREIFKVELGDIQIELFRTKHIPQQSNDWQNSFVSYGLLINERVFFSGDTRFDPDLIDLFDNRSEIMFHDVQFFPGAVHAPLEDLRTLPHGVKEKMFLVHYADNWPDQNISGFAGWTRQGVRYIID